MDAPRETVWEIPELTPTKHRILRSYLEWWFPTMLSTHERVHFIDGFSGPGKYTGDELGSPLVAIDTLMSSIPDSDLQRNVTVWFIDADKTRCSHLHSLLRKQTHRYPALPSLPYFVKGGTFAGIIDRYLSTLEMKHTTLPPIFTFIDPFGISDTPMSVIARLLRHPQSEVLITLMYEGANRCLAHPEEGTQERLTTFLGTERWRCIDLMKNREEQICALYRTQLQVSGNAAYVCLFHLKSPAQGTDYRLVFGTHDIASLEKMKDIFWEIDPLEGDTFLLNANRDLPSLFPQRHAVELADQLLCHFKGRDIGLHEIEEYILANTRFRRKDREHALKYLEQASSITITSPNHVHFL